ncbi:hypothetical protein [Terrarubrum flagellatum]|uniref:hypothetical protein n=1 Tax=Terrirubrum flagellatum TaxID=2895980 RepID=UPI00314558EF
MTNTKSTTSAPADSTPAAPDPLSEADQRRDAILKRALSNAPKQYGPKQALRPGKGHSGMRNKPAMRSH